MTISPPLRTCSLAELISFNTYLILLLTSVRNWTKPFGTQLGISQQLLSRDD